jgi:hypothetical protein
MNKKIKFNVLDFSIILLSVLSVLAFIFWNDIRTRFMYEEKEAEYAFVARGVTEEALNSLKIGDEVKFLNSRENAGKIISFEYEKEILSVILVDGSRKTYEGDTYVLTGKISARGREKENGFYVSDEYFIVPGKKFSLSTSKVNVDVEITEIDF